MQFTKAAEQNFSIEIFRVAKVIERLPGAVCELQDLNGTPIEDQFYREEQTPYEYLTRPPKKWINYWTRGSDAAFVNISSVSEITLRTSTFVCVNLA